MGWGRELGSKREGRFCLRNGKKGGCCARGACTISCSRPKKLREVFIILIEMDEESSDGEIRFYTALA